MTGARGTTIDASEQQQAEGPLAALRCPACSNDLAATADGAACPACRRCWTLAGNLLTPAQSDPPLPGWTAATQAFFDRHAQENDSPVPGARPALARGKQSAVELLAPLVDFDYRSRIVELALREEVGLLVEIGCGTGSNLLAAVSAARDAGRPLDVIGSDVSRAALDTASQQLERAGARVCGAAGDVRVVLIPAAGDSAPVRDAQAGLVLLVHVLHHAGDLRLLGEARRVLRPGGRLYVVDIGAGNPLYAACRLAWRLLPRRLRGRFGGDYCVDGEAPPVRLVRPAELDREASRLGLRLVSDEDCGLFLFLFYYAALLLPAAANRVPAAVWARLSRLDARLVSLPLLRRLSANVVRLYELPHCQRP